MIRSIRSKALRKFTATGNGSKLPVPAQSHGKLRRQIIALDSAIKPEDMNLAGWRFHGLQGVARYAVDVTANYRLTWGWDDPDAIDVDLEDYH
jgi:proteic killer suppression protein